MTSMVSPPMLANAMVDDFSISFQRMLSRIFYVHKNRLLAHIGAFDPVHLRLLLCAKHTTGARRTRPSRANKFKLIRAADVASDDQAAPTHPATCETSLADSTEG